MAKADVLKRVLERKVSDGQWETVDVTQRLTGVRLINTLREAYTLGVSVLSLLNTPGLSVYYQEDTGCHVVELDDNHFLHQQAHLLSQEHPANGRSFLET